MNYNQIILELSKVFAGAIIGTIFTVWYKDIKDKKSERKNLFLRMIAAKSYIQIPQMLINDLNMIEILFRGKKTVLEKYRLYYAELCVPENQIDLQRQKAYYWDLLRTIGDTVGYSNLDNKTLNSRYIPNVAFDEHLYEQQFREKVLKYLETGEQLQSVLIDIYQNRPDPEPPKIEQVP